jgi:hypothetical protein
MSSTLEIDHPRTCERFQWGYSNHFILVVCPIRVGSALSSIQASSKAIDDNIFRRQNAVKPVLLYHSAYHYSSSELAMPPDWNEIHLEV